MLLQRIDEVWLRDELMSRATEHPRLFVPYVDVNVLKSYCRSSIVVLYAFISEVLTYNHRVFLVEAFEIWGFVFGK